MSIDYYKWQLYKYITELKHYYTYFTNEDMEVPSLKEAVYNLEKAMEEITSAKQYKEERDMYYERTKEDEHD